MKISKIIKNITLVALAFIIIKIICGEIFDNRPFKFEKYRTSKELEEAVNFKFKIGSDIEEIRLILERSGAKCYSYKPKLHSYELINYEIKVVCEYNTSFFSLYPMEYYRIGLSGDKDNKLVKLGTHRVAGFKLFII